MLSLFGWFKLLRRKQLKIWIHLKYKRWLRPSKSKWVRLEARSRLVRESTIDVLGWFMFAFLDMVAREKKAVYIVSKMPYGGMMHLLLKVSGCVRHCLNGHVLYKRLYIVIHSKFVSVLQEPPHCLRTTSGKDKNELLLENEMHVPMHLKSTHQCE